MKKISIKLIQCYQYFSKNMGYTALPLIYQSQCRNYPTCSEYMIESINRYGFWKGWAKGLIRIIKCNPLTN